MEKAQKLNIIFQDENILVVEKPAGIVTLPDEKTKSGVFLELLLSEFPELKNVNERGGILHRLDKDTSGLILVAKNKENFNFLVKQFKERKVEKKYLALVVGKISGEKGVIETLVGRSPKDRKKQKAFLLLDPEAKKQGLRRAITEYKILKHFRDNKNDYTLVEVSPKTGRKHQIRAHLAYVGYPIAGDKVYGFKNQPVPKGLSLHFLHASYLKIELQDGNGREFHCPLPENLKGVVEGLVEVE